MNAFPDIRYRVSHLDDRPHIGKPKRLHILKDHVRIWTPVVSHRVRAEPTVRLISEFFCFWHNNGHHLVCIACGGANFHSHFPKACDCLCHVWLRIRKVRKDLQNLFFAEFINILNVFFCPVSAIFIPPESADTLSLKHGTDVVDFQHSHRSSDLLHRRVDPVLMESVKKGLHRCKAPIIYCCSCPVKNHCFVFHLSLSPLKILK